MNTLTHPLREAMLCARAQPRPPLRAGDMAQQASVQRWDEELRDVKEAKRGAR